MGWVEKVNQALSYIEKNLYDEIQFKEIEKIILSPVDVLQRFFVLNTGITLTEYIRRRKLNEAVKALKESNEKIVDIAVRMGYGSSDAFSLAFKKLFGASPTEVRESDIALELFPRMVFSLSITHIWREAQMEPVRFFESEGLLLEGCLVKNEGGDPWVKWEEMDSKENDDPRYSHYHQADDYPNESRAYEVRFYSEQGAYTDIFTGLAVTHEEPGIAWEYIKIPAAIYAVFDIDHKTNTIPQYISVFEWLENNKTTYKQLQWNADGRVDVPRFIICRYDHRGKYRDNKIMEYWIPLTKKA